MTSARRQMNVRLPPPLIVRADAKRASMGLSRDRYIEQVLEADLADELAAEADDLLARILGTDED
jgi:predicted DNA binding CopG/RHH family protein